MTFIFYFRSVLTLTLCRLRGAYAAIASFLLFAMIQFRDGPFVRPHPAFWRIILGVNLVYELALVFLLFQDVGTARHMLTYIDSNLGVPLPEKSYAEDCSLTPKTLWVWPSFILLFSHFNGF
jgi:phosphatidylserine synthase 2